MIKKIGRHLNTSVHVNMASTVRDIYLRSYHQAVEGWRCYQIPYYLYSGRLFKKKILQGSHEAQLAKILPSSNFTRTTTLLSDRIRIFPRRLQWVKMTDERHKIKKIKNKWKPLPLDLKTGQDWGGSAWRARASGESDWRNPLPGLVLFNISILFNFCVSESLWVTLSLNVLSGARQWRVRVCVKFLVFRTFHFGQNQVRTTWSCIYTNSALSSPQLPPQHFQN